MIPIKYLLAVFLLFQCTVSLSQDLLRLPVTVQSEGKTVGSLIPVRGQELQEGTYLNAPQGMTKQLLIDFAFDRIQAAYEKYLIDGNDILAWNKFLEKHKLTGQAVYKGRLLNSTIGVFSGIDSSDNKVVVVDINDNNDFSDDTVHVVPLSNMKDTAFSLDIPMQVYREGRVRDTVLRLGLQPFQAVVFSGVYEYSDLGLTFYNRHNYVGTYEGEKFDYAFNLMLPLSSNYYYGRTPMVLPYRMNTLDKKGNVMRSTLQKVTDTVYFDDGKWQMVKHNGSEIIFEKIASVKTGYQLGQTFPGISPFKDYADNSTRSIAPGKFVLIDFWGTWCAPCIEQIPELVRLWEKYKDRVTLISVLYDDEAKIGEAKEIIEAKGMDWMHVWDNRKASTWVEPMGIQTFPGFVFVGKDNTVLLNGAWDNLLDVMEDAINND